MCGGTYFYIGLSTAIKRKLEEFSSHEIDLLKNIDLLIKIDGLPLFKSSNTQLWPILASFKLFHRFVVALYCGSSKPDSCEEFSKEFMMNIIVWRFLVLNYEKNI